MDNYDLFHSKRFSVGLNMEDSQEDILTFLEEYTCAYRDISFREECDYEEICIEKTHCISLGVHYDAEPVAHERMGRRGGVCRQHQLW